MSVKTFDEGVCSFCHDPIESDEETLTVNGRLVHDACYKWTLRRSFPAPEAVREAGEVSGRADAVNTGK